MLSIRIAPIRLFSLFQHHHPGSPEFVTIPKKHSQPLKGSATSG